MYKFVRIADCDIGVWIDSTVRELSISAFETAIDQCVEEKGDFVLIARDLLHMNLPELSDVARAATKLNQVKEAGIRTYVVYGSHDYSAACQ